MPGSRSGALKLAVHGLLVLKDEVLFQASELSFYGISWKKRRRTPPAQTSSSFYGKLQPKSVVQVMAQLGIGDQETRSPGGATMMLASTAFACDDTYAPPPTLRPADHVHCIRFSDPKVVCIITLQFLSSSVALGIQARRYWQGVALLVAQAVSHQGAMLDLGYELHT